MTQNDKTKAVVNEVQQPENAPIEVMETAVEVVTESTLMSALTGDGQAFYSSFPADGTRAQGIKIYNAINNSNRNIADLEEAITVTDMIAHRVDVLNEDTGEVENLLRLILVAEDGKSYGSVATGVISSMQKILNIPGIGKAPWNPGLIIKPKQVNTRNGNRTNTLELLG